MSDTVNNTQKTNLSGNEKINIFDTANFAPRYVTVDKIKDYVALKIVDVKVSSGVFTDGVLSLTMSDGTIVNVNNYKSVNMGDMPSDLEPGKYLQVNQSGTGYDLSTPEAVGSQINVYNNDTIVGAAEGIKAKGLEFKPISGGASELYGVGIPESLVSDVLYNFDSATNKLVSTGITLTEIQGLFYKAYITIAITTDETNTFLVTGTGSDILTPPVGAQAVGSSSYNGYVKVSGFSTERAVNLSLEDDDDIVISADGVYEASVAWATFRHTSANSTVGFILGIERDGFYYFSQRPTSGEVPASDDLGNIAGGGTFDALQGDKISLWVAANNSGTVYVPNANITIKLIDRT